ncbi:mechanosensitive channel of small conductance-like 10 [Actinidia rufa]|uniref:Mechanosensitive channel of small conductance-like 10 n=1 Tax=Actinidia rufa TaxID=165716 RepID=A0A7J0GXN3_9ERIC|nr:mechanosensitive channel of small conductance-like 10 [Actinidia rufa]
MDATNANGKSSRSGEISMTESKKASPAHAGGGEVVVVIPGEPTNDSHSVAPTAPRSSCPSPEIARFSPNPSPNKPPKIPTNETFTRRKSLTRSAFSKPKSRFGEQSVPIDSNLIEQVSSAMQQRAFSPNTDLSNRASPVNKMEPTSSFRSNTIKEGLMRAISITHRTPLMASPGAQMIERTNSTNHMSFRIKKKGKGGKEEELIDVNKLYRMKQEKVSAWTMKVLVDVISSSGLSTISNDIDENFYEGDEQVDKEITNEMEAIAAAYHIFKNVAHTDYRYISIRMI